MLRTFGAVVSLAAGLTIACGSADDANPPAQSIPLQDLPALYAETACAGARACFGDVFPVVTAGEDCEQNAETGLRDALSRIERAIADGKVKYDGTRARACFDAAAAQGCSDDEPAACTEMVDGTVAVGGACSESLECQGADTYCKAGGSCPGRCAPRESAEGPCAMHDDCKAGLRCNREDGTCFAPAGAGDRCEGGTGPECSPGLICLGADNEQGRSGNCRTIAEAFSGSAGDPCVLDAPFCRADLRCVIESVDVATGMITTRCGEPVGSGAACKMAYPDVCPPDQYCAVPAQSLDGTCRSKPGAGQPCAARGDDAADICAPGTRCDGGQCRPLQKLGGGCQSYAVCYSEHCLSGGCAPAGACE
jgi:hypothetical protein